MQGFVPEDPIPEKIPPQGSPEYFRYMGRLKAKQLEEQKKLALEKTPPAPVDNSLLITEKPSTKSTPGANIEPGLQSEPGPVFAPAQLTSPSSLAAGPNDSPGLNIEPGLQSDPGPNMVPGPNLDPGLFFEPGAKYAPGLISGPVGLDSEQLSANLISGVDSEPGVTFDPGPNSEPGTFYKPGPKTGPHKREGAKIYLTRNYTRHDREVRQVIRHMDPSDFVVYYELLWQTYGTYPAYNTCKIVNRDIMEATGLSKNTVIKAIKKLISMGLISRLSKAGGIGEVSYYTVYLPHQAESTMGFKISKPKTEITYEIEKEPQE
jgi:predicted transcriptional regulator